jgi:ferredoxin
MATLWKLLRSLFPGKEKVQRKVESDTKRRATPPPHLSVGKTIVKVYIEEGCIPCSACEAECPKVFGETPDSAYVLEGADAFFEHEKDNIESAVYGCPVQVIKVLYSDGSIYGTGDLGPPQKWVSKS